MVTVHPTVSTEVFSEELRQLGLRRVAFLVGEQSGVLEATHPAFQPFADWLNQDTRDFDQHEAVFFELGAETGALLAAFLHRTLRGQGAGGVRHWPYDSLTALMSDGLRLSRGMSRKNALAGLWWGGGKGIIAQGAGTDVHDPEQRQHVYRDYGRFITSLRGAYVTAEDVGTVAADMAEIFRTTRFVTCVPPEVGGSGNPSEATARGVVAAMEASCLMQAESSLSLEAFQRRLGAGATLVDTSLDGGGEGLEPTRSVLAGKRIVMQGAGNVARFMMGLLLARGVDQIVAADVSEHAIAEARKRYPDPRLLLKRVAPSDLSLLAEPCAVFAPCALGGVLNPETIPLLNTQVVCGAANNQLLDDARDGQALAQRGILFVPDFVANRMGIVSCANEQYGSLPSDPSILRHFDPSYEDSIQTVTFQVLKRAQTEGVTPSVAANHIADELIQRDHPIWPHRTGQILRALSLERWHLKA
ncbi:MAG: hypothetical protein RJA70_418 [Pseudomonadota bacterium]|jgi:glutamate dehydrogenase/leucine dehydrogenase